MKDHILILGYGSLIWDLDDLAPKVRGDWHLSAGPPLPLEFSRISPKRKQSLVVVIDPAAGDPCPTHAIESARDTVAEAVTDLAARERTTEAYIGWVDTVAGAARGRWGQSGPTSTRISRRKPVRPSPSHAASPTSKRWRARASRRRWNTSTVPRRRPIRPCVGRSGLTRGGALILAETLTIAPRDMLTRSDRRMARLLAR